MEQHFLQGGFGKNPIFFGKFRKIYMQGKKQPRPSAPQQTAELFNIRTETSFR